MGSPDEIAKAATFLASDDSSLITTGIEPFVDGVHGANLRTLGLQAFEPGLLDNTHYQGK